MRHVIVLVGFAAIFCWYNYVEVTGELMTAVLRSKIKTIVPVRHGFIDGTGGI